MYTGADAWRVKQIVESKEDGKPVEIQWVSAGTPLDVVSSVAQILSDSNEDKWYNTLHISITRVQ